ATVVDALLEAVLPGGTLLFPTHSWALAERPNDLSFDVRSTPAMRIGAIPEAARRKPGAQRSLHATHSVVAFGPRTGIYVRGHERCDTPCGVGSPYHTLAERSGLVLLLGCDHRSNTSIHMVEELLELPRAMEEGRRTALLTGYDGTTLKLPTRMHSFRLREFMRVDEPMSRLGIQRTVRVGPALCRVVDARRQRDWLLEELRRDPGWLFG
ncbi:MAG TPA: AAC(3) family N-acetyltransferase, partial [Fimbriimonas sp.]